MFIAARHLISTDLRLEFLPYVDEFMDDNILLGLGVTAHQSLRSLALTVCADVVHHLRAELSLPQLNLVIHKMCCHVHDLALPFHHQTMCCRVLSQLVGNLSIKAQGASHEEREVIISLFQLMLETFLRKVEGLSEVRSEWGTWLRKRPANDGKRSSKSLDEVDVERRKVVDAVYGMLDPQNEAPLKGTDTTLLPRIKKAHNLGNLCRCSHTPPSLLPRRQNGYVTTQADRRSLPRRYSDGSLFCCRHTVHVHV